MSLDFSAVVHVNVNCSELDRSLAFYRDALGLIPLSHTAPIPQDGAGFGMPGPVQWDAWIIHDDRGLAAQGIDLLEWKLPPPVGVPATANELGLSRLLLATPQHSTRASPPPAPRPSRRRPRSAPAAAASSRATPTARCSRARRTRAPPPARASRAS